MVHGQGHSCYQIWTRRYDRHRHRATAELDRIRTLLAIPQHQRNGDDAPAPESADSMLPAQSGRRADACSPASERTRLLLVLTASSSSCCSPQALFEVGPPVALTYVRYLPGPVVLRMEFCEYPRSLTSTWDEGNERDALFPWASQSRHVRARPGIRCQNDVKTSLFVVRPPAWVVRTATSGLFVNSTGALLPRTDWSLTSRLRAQDPSAHRPKLQHQSTAEEVNARPGAPS